MREMCAAPGDELRLGDGRAGLEQDERARRLAPFLVGLGDDRGFDHLRMAIEAFLDFERADVLAARNDDVLGAILDLDVIVRMPHAEIAGVVPAAAESSRRG